MCYTDWGVKHENYRFGIGDMKWYKLLCGLMMMN